MQRLALAAVLACGHAAPQSVPQPAAPPLDLVSAATAAGTEVPHDLTWPPGKAEEPAKAVFKNVQVLGDLTAGRLMAGMMSMKSSVGLRCDGCHLEKSFKADDLASKRSARAMLRMSFQMNHDFMGGRAGVTCYTCHRGAPKPPPFEGQPQAPPEPLPTLSELDAKKPAEEVYKNIRALQGVPAGRFPQIMGFFTAWLGVSCTHCHVQGAWHSDAKAPKQRARQMLEMVSMTSKDYYGGGDTPVHCGMCHRGQARPARVPSDDATALR